MNIINLDDIKSLSEISKMRIAFIKVFPVEVSNSCDTEDSRNMVIKTASEKAEKLGCCAIGITTASEREHCLYSNEKTESIVTFTVNFYMQG